MKKSVYTLLLSEGLHLIFKFREVEGEKLLYEEVQRLYFKR